MAVGEGYYATAAALEDEQDAREALAERVVTTHSAASAETGDAQTIRGLKTFTGLVTANGGVATTSVYTAGNSSGVVVVSKDSVSFGANIVSTQTSPTAYIKANGEIKATSITGNLTGNVTSAQIKGVDGEDMQEGEKLLEINADEITLNNGTWVWFGDSGAGINEDDGDIVLQPATGKNVVFQGDGAFRGRLDGLIPHVHLNAAQTDIIKPVGAIVLLAVKRLSAITTPTGIIAGCTIESGTDWQLSEATLDRDSSTGGIKMLAPSLATITGKFVVMSSATFSAQYESQLMLAIKIAEAQ